MNCMLNCVLSEGYLVNSGSYIDYNSKNINFEFFGHGLGPYEPESTDGLTARQSIFELSDAQRSHTNVSLIEY